MFVFVYGTLRAGGVREMTRLFPGIALHGTGRIRGVLYDFGAYPGLQLDPPDGWVTGEVYPVDAAQLALLDEIEQFIPTMPARSFYFRREITATLRDDHRVTCWTYVFNPAHFSPLADQRIPDGDWINHVRRKGELPVERWPDGRPIQK
jgi:gamma-glutamylcyclotransferase (GGCT)/AIG2-like uncharacterized protein YtfP